MAPALAAQHALNRLGIGRRSVGANRRAGEALLSREAAVGAARIVVDHPTPQGSEALHQRQEAARRHRRQVARRHVEAVVSETVVVDATVLAADLLGDLDEGLRQIGAGCRRPGQVLQLAAEHPVSSDGARPAKRPYRSLFTPHEAQRRTRQALIRARCCDEGVLRELVAKRAEQVFGQQPANRAGGPR